MAWLYFAVVGYFLLAFAAVMDRVLLAASAVNPARYVYIISVLGGIAAGVIFVAHRVAAAFPGLQGAEWFIFVYPDDIVRLSIAAFFAGCLYSAALFVYFYALDRMETSRVVPVVGAAIPVFILILSSLTIREELAVQQVGAFVLLLAGSVSLNLNRGIADVFRGKKMLILLGAAFLFASHYIVIKGVYIHIPFLQTMLFVQTGSFAGGLLIYALFRGRFESHAGKNIPVSGAKKALVILSQIIGGLGGSCVQLAVFFGSVVLVNALQGIQYAFLFIILFVLRPFLNALLGETWTVRVVAQKTIGIILIAFGIVVIAVAR